MVVPPRHDSETTHTIGVTGEDLRARAHREQMHVRLLWVSAGFCFLFSLVAVKLTIATVLRPMAPEQRQIAPQVPKIPKIDPKGSLAGDYALPQVHRASIVDRNGQTLALSLPVAQVYANPQELIDPQDVAHKLKSVLHDLNEQETAQRLARHKQFVYIARNITPQQELAINNLGIPGIYFEPGEQRHYPLGHMAAQIMGAVDIDDNGIAGVERFFNKRLLVDRKPLRLSLDIRVQSAVREEVAAAKDMFQAIGACGIVMDVRTGEIIAMVSLPDYDANEFSHATNDERFNRAVTGLYEPGSTFKLQTTAMGLETGTIHIWDSFSSVPLKIGRFTIRDMKNDHFAPWLSLPEVMAYSSNPAAAHIALDVGGKRQAEWLRGMGFFAPVPVELPEAARPLVPRQWGLATTMTVGFGHGVAEPPLAIVRGTAATVNGGILVTPTLLDQENLDTEEQPLSPAAQFQQGVQNAALSQTLSPSATGTPATSTGASMPEAPVVPQGVRVLSESNSALLRKLLRLDVTQGTGKTAESPGYFVGGKTGTAEKIGPHGGYLKHVNISAFTSIFPMNAPRYAVYVMLDSPQATPQTHGWTTAGWNAAPTVSRIISRIGPMLQIFPDLAHASQIDAQLAIPMHPAVPRGVRPLGPGNDPGDPRKLEAEHRAAKLAAKQALAIRKKTAAETMDE
ncbi:peptidoglycan D,D-transpeptidase FtsI family protein [Acetobacter syzygii]|uniref:peptidoglycan D,D-transpeptidase FtsI family protein n=1 Tax=Acetobacter syzygii TaxID=146476 RepID=UPI0005DAADEB|nr:penicillin-binding protein 2 [Acetobacter syzygii]GAN71585.1 cell division transpeptidase FtsI [Acetobacter syzygii]GBR62489.1 cell division transpeptidase FtsI [Acetobacter syzygii NRIC 0483]GEL56578.1 peptidoglycan glycosyltransferase [Acetobacter syzygii]